MTILIVIPVLTLLMFSLGLTLTAADFRIVARRPRAVATGLAGQLLLLPVIALGLGAAFGLDGVFYFGLMLIACSPGGSSSNVFSMLARGDVALSVSLTALSSLLTLVTIPVVMGLAATVIPGVDGREIELPVGRLMVQNLVLTLLPVLAGMFIRWRWEAAALRMARLLGKVSLPLLVLLVVVFYSQNSTVILDNLPRLGLVVAMMVALAMLGAVMLSRASRLDKREQRTLVIELGMQNAAQAIALASSPFVFDNETMAVPAIIYSLMMNVLLIAYVMVVKRRH